ncbi:MAG TPA: GNAT family N-acetyltransferase [Gaiellaceae bacterium]|nr:GNAT family N-acetyltransferase [Gaiellaceae bacterium]
MDVRNASLADARRIEEIRVRTWRAAYREVFAPDRLDAMVIDETRWAHRINEPPPGWTIIVADVGERVVGFASTGPSRDQQGVGELYAIYVEPNAWSTGAGRALIVRSEAELAATWSEATLWVLEENVRARRFYERAGWEHDGVRKLETFLETEVAEVRYRKRFPDRH